MSKKQKPLSHAEIWDDSALINSWNDALQEYKHYHSLHARGEKVEEVLRQAQEADEAPELGIDQGSDGEQDLMEDGEIEFDQENIEVEEPAVEAQNKPSLEIHEGSETVPMQQNQAENSTPGINLPTNLAVGMGSEAMRNLMMSWYYAGYYTGFYEGQQAQVRLQGQSRGEPNGSKEAAATDTQECKPEETPT